jgi:hypothetical protein
MLLVSAVICAFVLFFALLICALRLEEHRNDIRAGEAPARRASPVWPLSVFNPAHYTHKGRALLRWFVLLYVAWLVTLVVLVLQFWHRGVVV